MRTVLSSLSRHWSGLKSSLMCRPKCVLNERTGTIVMGENVRISTVAITHGNLSLVIKETPQVSQPAPFSKTGETKVVPRTDLKVEEENRRLYGVAGRCQYRRRCAGTQSAGGNTARSDQHSSGGKGCRGAAGRAVHNLTLNRLPNRTIRTSWI